MRRINTTPRQNWQASVEAAGLAWHTSLTPRTTRPGGAESSPYLSVCGPAPGAVRSGENAYWNESAFYEFTAKEIEALEAATNELAAMALSAVQHIIDNHRYDELGIPEHAIPLIEKSWHADSPSLYGRFDLAYDGVNPPKLLEYNADTPTSLLEAAVVQWYWLEDTFPSRDQFNSLHPRLIDCWREFEPFLPGRRVGFCSGDDVEDGITVTYLLDTARQAGLTGTMFPIGEIGWDGSHFVGPDDRPLEAVFELYPWEWMIREEFGKYLSQAATIWIEPAWKMSLSNKGMLPVLWRLYRGHPNLLEARFGDPGSMQFWVKKPLLGREGSNVTLCGPQGLCETEGNYGAEEFVYQELAPLRCWGGRYAVIGSWAIGHGEGVAGGIGIRESTGPIITNTSQFVPHLFD
jgi:glutathionylspermidine synthase